MRFRIIFFFALSMLASTNVLARKTFDIEIVVKDEFTKEPIPNVQVICSEFNDTLYTDLQGKCTFREYSEQSASFRISNEKYVSLRKFESFEKRRQEKAHFEYYIYPDEELLDRYLQPLIREEEAWLNSIDTSNYTPCKDDSIAEKVEPRFPGGQEMFKRYISANLNYPEESIDMEEQGKVYVSFTIEKDGSVTNVRVERGVSKLLDREAKRLIREMPNWIPHLCNGRPQQSRMMYPLTFVLY